MSNEKIFGKVFLGGSIGRLPDKVVSMLDSFIESGELCSNQYLNF